MAKSGSFNTSGYQGRYLKFSWSIKSQSIANNTTTISWNLKGAGGAVSTWYKAGNFKVIIDGETVYSTSESSRITLYDGTTVASGTFTIKHKDDGTRTFTVSAQGGIYTYAVNCTGSETFTLDTIARKSTLAASNGTLGTEQTLTVTRQASSLTHTVTYKCGSASGTIVTKSTDTSLKWTPPLSLASQNTTGSSVSITLTITTYTGSTSVGSNTKTITCAIPASVKPSVSIAVTDPTGKKDTYGAYVQGVSKMKIVSTGTGSQGSTIKSYKVEADGKSYTAGTVETGVISGAGTLSVKVTVTDSRGRTATTSQSITVLAYTAPRITALTATRCDASGKASSTGEYLAVKFSCYSSALADKNTAAYQIRYKKSTDTSYTPVTLSSFAGQYSVTNGVYVIPADTSSSYDITFTVTDAIKSVSKNTTGSSVKKLWSLLKKAGKIVGIAIGKVAEEEGVLDIAYPLRLREGIKTDVLWTGTYYMTGGHTITLAKPVDKQPTGIALVFSAYEDGAALDNHFQTFFVPKEYVRLHNSTGFCVNLCTADFSYVGCKMLYISNTLITGNANNNQTGTKNGITYANNHWVLRYVIGV